MPEWECLRMKIQVSCWRVLPKQAFKPEDITDVFISHAHPDHIGGLVDKTGKLVFPNAGYFINKTEYDFLDAGYHGGLWK